MGRSTIERGWLYWSRRDGSDHRPRVLLARRLDAAPAAVARALCDAGYDVTVCGGPDDHHACAAVVNGYCPLADDADVIVDSLGLTDRPHVELVADLRLAHQDVPLVIETVADDPSDGAADAVTELVSAIESALRTHR